MKTLRLLFIEMIAENPVNKIGFSDSPFSSGPPNKFPVVVRNHNLLVFLRESPRAYLAMQLATTASIALGIVALFAERLIISRIVRAISKARDFVIRAEFYIWFLLAAVGAFVAVLLFELFPFSIARFIPWLACLAYFQALQLIAIALLYDRSEALFTLQCSSSAPLAVLRAVRQLRFGVESTLVNG